MGRPRKIVTPVTPKKRQAWEVIAEVMAQTCGIPGCVWKHHHMDAELVIQALASEGFEIRELK